MSNNKSNDDLKKAVDALGSDNSDTQDVIPAGGDSVYVFANLQNGQCFQLLDGSTVVIEGMPVSRLKGLDGQSFTGGKYGVTPVPAAQWDAVMQTYGTMKIFQSGLVFAAPSLERGKAMARERGGLRHGYEPVDPTSNRTKSSPKTEE